MIVELQKAIRSSIQESSGITDDLASYKSGKAIFTRRPVPQDADYPLTLVGPIVSRDDQDAINDDRPFVSIQVAIYGEQDTDYRTIESIADKVYTLFHRKRDSITLSNYSVTEIRCSGPVTAPVDDENKVGRIVNVNIQLYKG